MEPEYPLLTERIQSTLIDTMFIIILMFVISMVLDRYDPTPDWVRIVLFTGLWAFYEPACTSLGCTLGNYMKGIRVRRQTDVTRHIHFSQAFVRYVLKVSLGWISFFTIHSNPNRQAIHDLAAQSVMIKV